MGSSLGIFLKRASAAVTQSVLHFKDSLQKNAAGALGLKQPLHNNQRRVVVAVGRHNPMQSSFDVASDIDGAGTREAFGSMVVMWCEVEDMEIATFTAPGLEHVNTKYCVAIVVLCC